MPVPPGFAPRRPQPSSGLFEFLNNKGQKQPVKPTGRHAVALGEHSSTHSNLAPPLRYSVFVRSFETDTKFARPFTSKGDGRGFTTEISKRITARIHFRMDINVTSRQITYSSARSSETVQYCFPIAPLKFERRATAKPYRFVSNNYRISNANPSYKFKISAAEPIMSSIPIVGDLTPAIDLHGSLNIDINNDTLWIQGKIYGDGFPDAECFIRDKLGNCVMLDTYKHGPNGSPVWDLPLDGNMQMMDMYVAIELDCNGCFLWAWHCGYFFGSNSQREIPVIKNKIINNEN